MRRVRLLLIVVTAVILLMIAVPAYAAPAAHSYGGSSCVQWYTVQCGDTLGNIAWRYGTTAWTLANRNGISNPNVIYPGQTICVRWGGAPPPPPHPKPPPHHDGFWYTVQCGDMLRIIAAHYGFGTWELANINGIANPDRIYVGQRLWIPYR